MYTVYNPEVQKEHTFFVSDDAVLVHNVCRGRGKKAPSSYAPKPKAEHISELNKIKSGNGTPRIRGDGTQTIYGGNPHKRWKGALEWDVPGNSSFRILQKENKFGWTSNHYDDIHDF